jgi:hypothetical protein
MTNTFDRMVGKGEGKSQICGAHHAVEGLCQLEGRAAHRTANVERTQRWQLEPLRPLRDELSAALREPNCVSRANGLG